MQKSILAACAVVVALVLAGCTATTPVPAPQSPEATEVPSAPVETTAPVVDPEEMKASAVAAGRPEAAFDKNCQVWEMPKAITEKQEWANKLGGAWLDSKDAGCPDAITFPYYFVESFKQGSDGELIVIVEDAMNKIIDGPKKGEFSELAMVSNGVLDGIMDGYPEVSKVTAMTADGSRFGSSTLQEVEELRTWGGIR